MMIWLLFSLAMLALLVATLAVVLSYEMQKRWMRMFCVERSIPIGSMEGHREVKPVSAPEKPKIRMTVPIPGAQMFRKEAQTK